MFRQKLNPVIYLLIGLAILGLGVQLFTNTASLFLNLLMIVVVGAVIYGLLNYFVLRKRNPDDIRKYKKAVKQSKKKYKPDHSKKYAISKTSKSKSPLFQKSSKSKTNAPHLRVIEGNKHKRNKSAF